MDVLAAVLWRVHRRDKQAHEQAFEQTMAKINAILDEVNRRSRL